MPHKSVINIIKQQQHDLHNVFITPATYTEIVLAHKQE